MKIGKCIALSLMGWYLMMPPSVNWQIDSFAPLSQWKQAAAFDSAKACELEQTKQVRRLLHDRVVVDEYSLEPVDQKTREWAAELASEGKCIEAGDPRLGLTLH